jgi:cell division protein ZapA (FtsZ GTPase activity inhibitor)
MATKFDQYIREVEQQAKVGGPEAIARWYAFNAHYAMAREVRELRKEHKLTQKQISP